jgi:spore maturation protein CgeB
MINVFRNSKININFTSSSFGINIKSLLKIFFYKTNYSIKINNIADIIQNIKILFKKNTKQIKGRIFEITGCKGFLISEEVDHLNKFYNLKNEVVTFSNYLDLKSKIYFYLNNKEARDRIINNAYKKTIKYHTYENRFRNIFKKVI